MKAHLILCLIAGIALPAGAENILTRPEGCERVATAQYDNCEVVNHFTCSGTGAVVYRDETMDGDGVLGVETYDRHRGSVAISDSSGELVVSAKSRTKHPRAALTSGKRSEVIQGKGTVVGFKVVMTGRVDYWYKGATKRIAGETFHRLPFKGVAKFEALPEFKATGVFEGIMLFHEQRDLWITESTVMEFGDQPKEQSRLKNLALPGQLGFGEAKPKFGCAHLSMLGEISEVPV